MDLTQINLHCIAEDDADGRKPVIKLQALTPGEPHRIYEAKTVTSHFGTCILLELLDNVLFLPKRVTESLTDHVGELIEGIYAVVFIGEKDVGQPNPLIQFKLNKHE